MRLVPVMRLGSVLVGVCVLAGGCGGSSGSDTGAAATFPETTTCGLAIAFSGAATGQVRASDQPACLTQRSADRGIDTELVLLDGPLKSFQLRVAELHAGQVGDDFAAVIDLKTRDDRSWHVEGCTVNVTRHADVGATELGERYRLAGHGHCPTSTTNDAGSDLALGDFSFVIEIVWAHAAVHDAG